MMTRFVEKLAIPVIFIAGGMAYLSKRFDMPFLVPIAIAVFGVFALLLGADTLIQGQIQLFNRLYNRREYYVGISARLLGIIILLSGAGSIAFVVWDWFTPADAGQLLGEFVKSKRGLGVFLLVFGFFTMLFGLIRLISGSAHSPEERNAWTDLDFRLHGLLNLIVGALLFIAGGWLFVQ